MTCWRSFKIMTLTTYVKVKVKVIGGCSNLNFYLRALIFRNYCLIDYYENYKIIQNFSIQFSLCCVEF